MALSLQRPRRARNRIPEAMIFFRECAAAARFVIVG
jgi:hypothetical protein